MAEEDVPSVTMNRQEPEEEASTAEVAAQREADLKDRLERIESNSSDNNPAVARLLGDPDIQKVLAARRDGKDITVKEEGGQDELEDITPTRDALPPDLDELSNEELSKIIVTETLKEVKGLVKSELKPVMEQIESARGLASAQETRHIQTQLDALKTKYPDFERLGPEMVNIAKSTPGLSPEEYYVIAKGRTGASEAPAGRTETEHPTNTSARGTSKRDDRPRGRAGIRGLIRDAASSLDINLPERPG